MNKKEEKTVLIIHPTFVTKGFVLARVLLFVKKPQE